MTTQLEKERFVSITRIPLKDIAARHFGPLTEVSFYQDRYTMDYIVQVATRGWKREARRTKKEYGLEPTNWWHLLKSSLMPRWLQRWFPIRRTRRVVEYRVYYFCPHLTEADVWDHQMFLDMGV